MCNTKRPASKTAPSNPLGLNAEVRPLGPAFNAGRTAGTPTGQDAPTKTPRRLKRYLAAIRWYNPNTEHDMSIRLRFPASNDAHAERILRANWENCVIKSLNQIKGTKRV